MRQNDPQFKVRIPSHVHEKLRRLAFESRRTMTSQIVVLLEERIAEIEEPEEKQGEVA